MFSLVKNEITETKNCTKTFEKLSRRNNIFLLFHLLPLILVLIFLNFQYGLYRKYMEEKSLILKENSNSNQSSEVRKSPWLIMDNIIVKIVFCCILGYFLGVYCYWFVDSFQDSVTGSMQSKSDPYRDFDNCSDSMDLTDGHILKLQDFTFDLNSKKIYFYESDAGSDSILQTLDLNNFSWNDFYIPLFMVPISSLPITIDPVYSSATAIYFYRNIYIFKLFTGNILFIHKNYQITTNSSMNSVISIKYGDFVLL